MYQLLHVSGLKCHPQGVVITQVHKPTRRSKFCSFPPYKMKYLFGKLDLNRRCSSKQTFVPFVDSSLQKYLAYFSYACKPTSMLKTQYVKRKCREIRVIIKHKCCKFSQRIDHVFNCWISGKFIINHFILNLRKFLPVSLP